MNKTNLLEHSFPTELDRVRYEISYHLNHYYAPFLKEDDALLDIGIGTGLAAHIIRQVFPHITIQGLDIQNSLQYAFDLDIYNGIHIPYKSKNYDVSLLLYVLHHARDPFAVFSEAVRVTKRNILIVEEYDDQQCDKLENDKQEDDILKALGFRTVLFQKQLGQNDIQQWSKKCGVELIRTLLLPTWTKRKVKKYFYVIRT